MWQNYHNLRLCIHYVCITRVSDASRIGYETPHAPWSFRSYSACLAPIRNEQILLTDWLVTRFPTVMHSLTSTKHGSKIFRLNRPAGTHFPIPVCYQ